MILSDNHPDDESWPGGVGPSEESGDTGEDKNSGTLLLDVTCAPQHIAFPQDINLLNESRENLKEIVDAVCYELKEQNPENITLTQGKIILPWRNKGNVKRYA